MKLAFLFSKYVLSHMQGHVRNLFHHPDMLYIFPSGYELPPYFSYLNNENVLFYEDSESLYSIIKEVDMLFLTEFYSLKDYMEKEYIKTKAYEKDFKNLSIYFIAHGVTGFYSQNDFAHIKKASPFTLWAKHLKENKDTTIITCCNFINKHLSNSTHEYNEHQLIKSDCIPQFLNNDILYNLPMSKSKKEYLKNSTVIFPVLHDQSNVDIISSIAKKLVGTTKNLIIKLKPKTNYIPGTLQFSRIKQFRSALKQSLKDIDEINAVITSDPNNVQYFHCGKVITINGGTSFFESLTYNNKTFNIEFDCCKEYQNIPFNSNKLLICKDINDFDEKLKLIENENYFDSDYETEKEDLFSTQMSSTIKKSNSDQWLDLINQLILKKTEFLETND